jgi:hypothetical protein
MTLTSLLLTKPRLNNRLMPAGRLEEANALTKLTGKEISWQQKSNPASRGGKSIIKHVVSCHEVNWQCPEDR